MKVKICMSKRIHIPYKEETTQILTLCMEYQVQEGKYSVHSQKVFAYQTKIKTKPSPRYKKFS